MNAAPSRLHSKAAPIAGVALKPNSADVPFVTAGGLVPIEVSGVGGGGSSIELSTSQL